MGVQGTLAPHPRQTDVHSQDICHDRDFVV